MLVTRVVAIAAVSIAFGAELAPASAQPRHLAMISVDGMRPGDSAGACNAVGTPVLAELRADGVHAAGVAGVLPTVTYPSHATLVTGTHPSRHGVLNNAPADRDAAWYFDSADIRGPTLWQAAKSAGRSVAIVTWPSSYGADVDYLIPEDLSSVADVAARIKAGSTPGLFESLEAATGPVRLLPFSDPEAGEPLDEMTAAFAAEIVRRFKPNVLFAHFLDLDHRRHREGVESAAACAALRRIDAHIGTLQQAYAQAGILEQSAFVVVSDHGFLPVHTAIDFRGVLAAAGWPELGRGPIDQVFRIETSPASVAFFARDPRDGTLAASLETSVRPRLEARFRGVLRWVAPEAVAAYGGFPGATFVLCASPGYTFGRTMPEGLFGPSRDRLGTHGHCPDEPGIDASFIASGAGVRALGAIPRIRMIDVAPTVAALLGIGLAETDGAPLGIVER